MPGLYIHIPFCRQACIYCDFHFSVNLGEKEKLVDAICKEIALQQEYLADKSLQSVYFGGGTPSVLSVDEVEKILSAVRSVFSIDKNAEITFELNPEDADLSYLSGLRKIGVNRLSVGIQSFNDEELKWMNRPHTAGQSVKCITDSQKAGFENISIDLIYGSKFQTAETWKETLHKAFSLGTQHISSYNLTVESKTLLDHMIKTKKEMPADAELGSVLFDILMEAAAKNGFEHYEISNFCKPGFMAVHNSNYWRGEHYLGVGPSAHSYNGISRRFNVKRNARYIKGTEENRLVFEEEILSDRDKYNEYVMTRLRTNWGCDKDEMKTLFGQKYFEHFERELKKHHEFVTNREGKITLNAKGKHFADRIAADLFL